MSVKPEDVVTVTVPRRAGLVFQVQNVRGTKVWAVIEKGELEELVEKARLYDMESHDRLPYEAGKLSRQYALEHQIGLTEMIAADENAKVLRRPKSERIRTGTKVKPWEALT